MDLKFGRYFSLTQIIFLLELIYFAMQKYFYLRYYNCNREKYFYYIKYICIGDKNNYSILN